MSDLPEPALIELNPHLGITEAADLYQQLNAHSNGSLSLDASQVEHVGGLCLQILRSAQVAWAEAGHSIDFVSPSAAFEECTSFVGLQAL